jgi:hypothetical protein
LLTGGAQAQSAGRPEMMASVPATVTDWYKQDNYDPSNTNIGKIDDVLLSDDGQVNALMVRVGGFLGADEKGRCSPPQRCQEGDDEGQQDTMNTIKDALKSAPSFKYDRDKTGWYVTPADKAASKRDLHSPGSLLSCSGATSVLHNARQLSPSPMRSSSKKNNKTDRLYAPSPRTGCSGPS